jgi:transglutaminase-like putative cysteine protease
VVTATWARIVFHLRRETEENLLVRHRGASTEATPIARVLASRRVVSGRLLLGTGAASLLIFVSSAIFFLAMPRVGAGFFMKGRTGLSMAGFSDGVQLGGHGVIKNDATIVMRVRMPAGYDGATAPPIHWRGVAFDAYQDGIWSRTQRSPMSTYTIDRASAGRERRRVARPGDLDWDLPTEELMARSVRQDIWLEPMETPVLFAADAPRVYDIPVGLRRTSSPIERNDEMRLEHAGTIHYTVWSELAPPAPEVLRAATGPLPVGYEAFLALPDDITARTRALAQQITAGASTDFDRATMIQDWLRANLSYTLDQGDGPQGQEPIDYFLFDRRRGHCEYFASAFVIMARALGVPSRQVAGFLGGEWNEYDSYLAVRAGDAHAWPEVFFPGRGWVAFEPTPGAQTAAAKVDTGLRAKLRRFLDTLRFQWTRWVIDYDLGKQLSMFKGIGSSVKGAARSVRAALVRAKDAARDHWPITLAIGVALAGLIGWRVARGRRRRVGHPAGDRRARSRSAVAAVYVAARRDLAARGIGRDPALTARELAAEREAAGAAEAGPLRALTELYYAAEYGQRAADAAEAAALRTAIRQALRAAPPATRARQT